MSLPFPNNFRSETWKGIRARQFPKREDAFQQVVGDLLREALPGGAFPVRTAGPDGSIDAFIARDASLPPLFQYLPGPIIVECKDNDDALPQVQKNVLGAWNKVKAKLEEQADKGWPDRFAPWSEARGYLYLTSAVFPDTESRQQLERALRSFFDKLRAEGKSRIEQVRVADWSDLRDVLDRWPRIADRWLGLGLRKVVGHDEHKEVLSADFRRFLLKHHLPFCAPDPGSPTHPEGLFERVMARAMTGGVLVTGPGGVGKTRLLVEVGELAHERGLRVLHVLPGEPALEHEELFEQVLQGQQDTLLLFDYVDEAPIDFDAVRRHLLPEAASRDMRVGVLASARSWRNVQRRNDRGVFFEHVELRLDEEQAARLLGQMRLRVAPAATALLGEREVTKLVGTRPIIALLVLRELERRATSGTLRESTLRGIRSGDLVGWLRRRLAEDELLVRPAASPWEDDEIPPRLVATAALLASTPQGEEELRTVALEATRGLPRSEQIAQRAVPALVELGWLEARDGEFSAVHDVIVDEVLGQTLGDANGTLRHEILGRLLEPARTSARTLNCLAVTFQRLLPDLETAPSGFERALAEGCREWLTRRVPEMGEMLVAARPGEGSMALGSLLGGGVWAQVVEEHWEAMVVPWLQRHETYPYARHLFYRGLAQHEEGGKKLVAPALRWLIVNGRAPKANFVLASLLGREDLSLQEVTRVCERALFWLERHGLHPDAQFVLPALLKREDLSTLHAATVCARALAWLEIHASARNADFVLRTLLVRGGLTADQAARTVAHALTWLGAHGHLLDAQFALHALLRRSLLTGASMAETHAFAMDWLGRHGSTFEAGFVLPPLLMCGALPVDIAAGTLTHTREWLRAHGGKHEARFVLRALLDRGALGASDVELVNHHAVAWLDQHATRSSADFVLNALLDRNGLNPGEAARVSSAASRWLELFGTSVGAAFLFKSIFRRQDLPTEEADRYCAWMLAWLKAHGTRPEASPLLGILLARKSLSSTEAAECRARAFAWLDIHGGLLDAFDLLYLLLERGKLPPDDTAVLRRRAFSWLSFHGGTHQACFVLPSLLACTDLTAVDADIACIHARDWLRSFRERPRANLVLQELVKRAELNPEAAQEVVEEALAWLKSNNASHKAAFLLVACLRSPHVRGALTEQVLDATIRWAEAHRGYANLDFVIVRVLRVKDAPRALHQRVARLGVEWLEQAPHNKERHQLLTTLLAHATLLSTSEVEFLERDTECWLKVFPPSRKLTRALRRRVLSVTTPPGVVQKPPRPRMEPAPHPARAELKDLIEDLSRYVQASSEPPPTAFVRDALLRVREKIAAETNGLCLYVLTGLLPVAANTGEEGLLNDVETLIQEVLQSDGLEPYQLKGFHKGCLRLLEEGVWRDAAQGRRALHRLGIVPPEARAG